ncbi:MAG: hypothetical protein MUE41_02465 [Gemmatimonadaceae bacterium]|jgi:hypothetical protein|nr:hypothetical protein [Gemmatimonadaceae bacterium]
MDSPALSLCRDPEAARWQLGDLRRANGRSVLLAWERGTHGDRAVPTTVRAILACALARVARVSFLDAAGRRTIATDWTLVDQAHGEYVRTLAPALHGGRWLALVPEAPRELCLRSAHDAEVIARMFTQDEYPWERQAQVALLSDPHGPLPTLGHDALLGLFEGGWVTSLDRLGPLGVAAVLRPGRDGEAAVIACSSARLREEVVRAVHTTARQFGALAVERAEEEIGGARHGHSGLAMPGRGSGDLGHM